MRTTSNLAFRFLRISLFLLVSAAAALAQDAPIGSDSTRRASEVGPDEAYFEEQRDLIFETGMGRNDIPPINRPTFISVQDAALGMDETEHVFVLDYGNPDGKARVYPQQVLVWHVVGTSVVGSIPRARRQRVRWHSGRPITLA